MIYKSKEKFTEAENSVEWKKLLDSFHSIIEPKGDKKEVLLKLKEQATQNPFLTERQMDAIRARCDNFLNDTYGNTKTAANMAYGGKE